MQQNIKSLSQVAKDQLAKLVQTVGDYAKSLNKTRKKKQLPTYWQTNAEKIVKDYVGWEL